MDNPRSNISYYIRAKSFLFKSAKFDAEATCKYSLDVQLSGKCKLLYAIKETYPLHSFQDSVWQLKCTVANSILFRFINVTYAMTSSMPHHIFSDPTLCGSFMEHKDSLPC